MRADRDGIDVGGEFVRNDLTDAQKGVPLFVQTQVIDIETCEPVDDIFVEIWSESTATATHKSFSVPE